MGGNCGRVEQFRVFPVAALADAVEGVVGAEEEIAVGEDGGGVGAFAE
jgi:hypothetical protein